MNASPAVRPRPRTWSHRLFFGVHIWAILWVVIILFDPADHFAARFQDAGVYYYAGLNFLHGDNLYGNPDFRQWPLVAFMWAPLSALPAGWAVRIWAVLTGAGVAYGFWCLVRRLQLEGIVPNREWITYVVVGPSPLIMFAIGQMSGLCFAALAVGMYQMRQRPWLAGLLFAAMAAKPHLVLLAIPALIAGSPVAIATFAAGMLAWPAGSLLVSGPGVFAMFLQQIYQVRDSNVGLVTSTLSSILPFPEPWHTLIQAALLLALVTCFGWLLWMRWGTRSVISGHLVDGMTAITVSALPYALMSDLLFVSPALLRLGYRRGGAPSVRPLVAWWLIPAVATALNRVGYGGIAALLPVVIVVLSWRQWRALHASRVIDELSSVAAVAA